MPKDEEWRPRKWRSPCVFRAMPPKHPTHQIYVPITVPRAPCDRSYGDDVYGWLDGGGGGGGGSLDGVRVVQSVRKTESRDAIARGDREILMPKDGGWRPRKLRSPCVFRATNATQAPHSSDLLSHHRPSHAVRSLVRR